MAVKHGTKFLYAPLFGSLFPSSNPIRKLAIIYLNFLYTQANFLGMLPWEVSFIISGAEHARLLRDEFKNNK